MVSPMPPLRALVVLAGLLLVSSCSSTSPSKTTEVSAPHADRVAAILIGEFSSARQAERDGDFFPIRLRHIPIWTSRDDGPWLYVEQAVETMLDNPYRQRIYRIVELDEGARSDVFELPGELRAYVRQPASVFGSLDPSMLSLLEGCSITLEPGAGEMYVGGTTGTGCRTTRENASYTTSEVELEAHELRTWDRGWTDQDEHAWGAKSGPYIFERLDIE